MTPRIAGRFRMPLAACLAAVALLAAAPTPAQPPDRLTVEKILTLLKAGSPPETLAGRVQKEGGDFDLTIEDVVRLRAAGATPELIRLMARGAVPSEATAPAESGVAEVAPDSGPPAVAAPAPSPDALTVRRVLKLYHKAVPPEEIAAQIAAKGLKEPPGLQELLDLRAQGVPEVIVRALAQGGTRTPLAIADVVGLLQRQTPHEAVEAEIRSRGIQAAPTIDEVIALRQAGAGDAILTALNDAAPAAPAATGGGGATEEIPEVDQPVEPEEGAPRELTVTPPAAGEDRVWISSVPLGLRVYVAPSRTRIAEAFRRDYLAGRTPLSLSLPPGDYRVILQKDPGSFERGLAPAWRTLHDTSSTRSLLDNADLTFDPRHCCLPGSLSGAVEVRAVPVDLPQGIIGDLFDGLPPWLFDGESLQILSVKDGRVARSMKVYDLRKNPGQSRILIGSFLPSEGDPLDQEAVAGLPAGTPFDDYVDAPGLDFLTRTDEMPALATSLGVETGHLSDAVAMLRRAGKAILHQQVPGGFRLLTIALDDEGRLRVTDQTVQPVDPFAPPPPSKPKKKKKTTVAPPPPLPAVQREVVPGLELPRLAIDNKSSKGLGLLLSNDLFCFVPARTLREFVVDPGTFDARVLSGGAGAARTPGAQGALHFSYHARYTMTF